MPRRVHVDMDKLIEEYVAGNIPLPPESPVLDKLAAALETVEKAGVEVTVPPELKACLSWRAFVEPIRTEMLKRIPSKKD